MKGKNPRLVLLGNNAGNNLGDAAILASIMDVLTKEIPNAEFYVPTINPPFVRKNYGHKYNVHALDAMPWTGSVRLFGLPTLWAMWKSDCALICDGIIFGKNFLNPIFNFLITLVFLVPWAKLTNCKLVCYSCGIGPFPKIWSKWAAKYVINASDFVTMRERDSEALARELGVTVPIEVTGDAAFLNQVEPDERAAEIIKDERIDDKRPWFGINVTKYIDSWLKPEERVRDKSEFLNTLANAIHIAQQHIPGGFVPVLFSTHPMDEEFSEQLAQKVAGRVIINSVYSSHEMQALMRRCELFIGMRFHSLVLASAVEVPIVGLVYAPKVKGFMRLLDCTDLSFELNELTAESLAETIEVAWEKRAQYKEQQKTVIDQLKAGARSAAVSFRKRFFPELNVAPKDETYTERLTANT